MSIVAIDIVGECGSRLLSSECSRASSGVGRLGARGKHKQVAFVRDVLVYRTSTASVGSRGGQVR